MDRLAAYVPDLALSWERGGEQPWVVREASMMFADLSGFTRLSERVARVKGAGAEVVKATINAVFEPCIDAVLREGGDVVKFAGDGLMMMFTGPGHELAAARSAVALQGAVRRIGRVETPAGPARIGVSIGISSGEYLCLLSRVGRLEPVVVGEALDRMFAAEAFAKSGQVVVDERMAEVLPPTALRRVAGSERMQLRSDAPELAPHGAEALRGLPLTDAAKFIEPRIRVAIEHGDTPPEHRSAAISFLALDGLAAVRAASGEDGLHAHIEHFLGSVHRASEATEVCWLESDSDRDQIRVLLTAGAPYRTDIDEQRMVDAVWRIHQECAGMPIRAGISRGKVFVADVGHPLRRTYNVMGDAVNVAARLAGKAAQGEVLALEAVARAPHSMAKVEPLPPLAVKGKKQPLTVCRVTGLHAADDLPDGTVVTSGRTAELHAVRSLVDALSRGQGGVVTVVGEPGMGKSHLVREALADWTGPMARTRGLQFEHATLFGAASRLLRSALGIAVTATPEDAGAQLAALVQRTAPELVERLPLIAEAVRAAVPSTAVVDAIRPEFRLEQTLVATVALLHAVITAPTVIVVDDIDPVDGSSLALIGALATATTDSPWLLVVTSRGVRDDALHGQVVRLAPLADEDIRQLVLRTAGDVGLTAHDVAALVRRAGGNPMIARELTLGWTSGARDVELPDAVERAVASRIDNLPAASRVLMRELSVAGIGAEWSLVRAVLGDAADDDSAWGPLDEYVDHVAGAVHFAREVYAAAAYQGLAHRRRSELHGLLAAELARRPYARFEAARIAEHAHAGGLPDLAWRWSLEAAGVAGTAGSAHDVATHLRHALESADRGADVDEHELLRVIEEWGDASERAGNPDDAHAAYTRARKLVPAGSATMLRLLRKHARVAERAGSWVASLRWVTRGLKASSSQVGEDLDVERAELLLTAALVRSFQGDDHTAMDLARQAEQLAETVGARRTIAQANLQLQMCCSNLSLVETAAAHGLRALESFELLDDHLGLANLRLNLGVSCYDEGRWDQALHHYARSVVEYEIVGDLVGAALTQNNRAEVLTDQGHDDEAWATLEDARRGFRATSYRMGVAATSSALGRLATRRGDLDGARRWLTEAKDEFTALDSAYLLADNAVRFVELDVWRGAFEDALDAVEGVQAAIDATGPTPAMSAALSRLRAWALTGAERTRGRARARALLPVWTAAIDRARAEGFEYEVGLAIDAAIAVLGGAVDGPLVVERDRLFRRLGVVRPPRPPWLATV